GRSLCWQLPLIDVILIQLIFMQPGGLSFAYAPSAVHSDNLSCSKSRRATHKIYCQRVEVVGPSDPAASQRLFGVDKIHNGPVAGSALRCGCCYEAGGNDVYADVVGGIVGGHRLAESDHRRLCRGISVGAEIPWRRSVAQHRTNIQYGAFLVVVEKMLYCRLVR